MKIVCVGKIKEQYFVDGIDHYTKMIRKYTPFSIVECSDEPTPDGASLAMEDKIRQLEGQRILSQIRDDDYVIALCIDGKQQSTEAWSKKLKTTMDIQRGEIVFVIGGSLGLSGTVVKRANEKISFSDMTFPHQLMRMILCEQLTYALAKS